MYLIYKMVPKKKLNLKTKQKWDVVKFGPLQTFLILTFFGSILWLSQIRIFKILNFLIQNMTYFKNKKNFFS
jgi:hypothetical protein